MARKKEAESIATIYSIDPRIAKNVRSEDGLPSVVRGAMLCVELQQEARSIRTPGSLREALRIGYECWGDRALPRLKDTLRTWIGRRERAYDATAQIAKLDRRLASWCLLEELRHYVRSTSIEKRIRPAMLETVDLSLRGASNEALLRRLRRLQGMAQVASGRYALDRERLTLQGGGSQPLGYDAWVLENAMAMLEAAASLALMPEKERDAAELTAIGARCGQAMELSPEGLAISSSRPTNAWAWQAYDESVEEYDEEARERMMKSIDTAPAQIWDGSSASGRVDHRSGAAAVIGAVVGAGAVLLSKRS